MAWLKTPIAATSLPMTEVLAFSYAAMQPSNKLLDKYLHEIDKLESQGEITPRDHQLLRSSHLAQDEIMNLTLGEEDALTGQAITETLERVTNKIKRDESEKLTAEQSAHRKTQASLAGVRDQLLWRCRRKAKACAWLTSVLIAILLLVGIITGLGLRSSHWLLGGSLSVGAFLLVLLTIGNLLYGTTVKGIHQWIQTRCLRWLIEREAEATNLDLGE